MSSAYLFNFSSPEYEDYLSFSDQPTKTVTLSNNLYVSSNIVVRNRNILSELDTLSNQTYIVHNPKIDSTSNVAHGLSNEVYTNVKPLLETTSITAFDLSNQVYNVFAPDVKVTNRLANKVADEVNLVFEPRLNATSNTAYRAYTSVEILGPIVTSTSNVAYALSNEVAATSNIAYELESKVDAASNVAHGLSNEVWTNVKPAIETLTLDTSSINETLSVLAYRSITTSNVAYTTSNNLIAVKATADSSSNVLYPLRTRANNTSNLAYPMKTKLDDASNVLYPLADNILVDSLTSNIGVGSQAAPTHKLHVGGALYAASYCNLNPIVLRENYTDTNSNSATFMSFDDGLCSATIRVQNKYQPTVPGDGWYTSYGTKEKLRVMNDLWVGRNTVFTNKVNLKELWYDSSMSTLAVDDYYYKHNTPGVFPSESNAAVRRLLVDTDGYIPYTSIKGSPTMDDYVTNTGVAIASAIGIPVAGLAGYGGAALFSLLFNGGQTATGATVGPLRGDQGPRGDAGPAGSNGRDGSNGRGITSITQTASTNNLTVTYTDATTSSLTINLDYPKIGSNIDYPKLGLSNIDYGKIGLSNIDYGRLGLSNVDYGKIGLSNIDYGRLGYSNVDYPKLADALDDQTLAINLLSTTAFQDAVQTAVKNGLENGIFSFGQMQQVQAIKNTVTNTVQGAKNIASSTVEAVKNSTTKAKNFLNAFKNIGNPLFENANTGLSSADIASTSFLT